MKKRSVILSVIIIILLTISITYNWRVYFENIFVNKQDFNNVFEATTDEQGSYYLITSSHTKIMKLSADLSLVYALNNVNDHNKGFYYANDITVDKSNNLYVLSTYLDKTGSFVQNESVVKFDAKGNFEKVIYSKSYDQEEYVVASGKIKNIKIINNQLYLASCQGEQVELARLNKDSGKILEEKNYVFKNAEQYIYDIDIYPDFNKICFTTKDGKLYTADLKEQVHTVKFSDDNANDLFIPAEVQVSLDNIIYISDISSGKITAFDSQGKISVISESIAKSKGYSDDYYEFKKIKLNSQGDIIAVNNNKVIVLSNHGALTIASKWHYSGMKKLINVVFWIQLIVLIYLVIFLLRIILSKTKFTQSNLAKEIIIIIIMLAVTSLIITNYIYQNMTARYEENIFTNLLTNLEVANEVVDGDTVEEIKSLDQYMSNDFVNIVDQLNRAITVDGNIDYSMYSGVYKIVDGKVLVLTYNDTDTDMFHPYIHDFENSPFYEVYTQGKVCKEKETDVEGAWMYALAPLYNSEKEIVGVIEVGKDMLAYNEANKEMIKELFLNLSVLIAILLFIFMEFAIFNNKVLERIKESISNSVNNKTEVEASIVRFVCFLIYIGIFMSSTFIVLYSKDLYTPLWGLPKNIVIALPLVVETSFLALTSLVYGYIKSSYGIKTDMLLSCIIMIAASIFTAYADNSGTLILSRAIFGIGFGLFLISVRTYIALADSDELREQSITSFSAGALAGVNTGAVIGSLILDDLGYEKVFYAIACTIFIGGIVLFKFITNKSKNTNLSRGKQKPSWHFKDFIFDKNVLVFFFLEFLPSSICGMFLFFFFPLFVDENGLSPLVIGRAFLLYGLFTIYLGPPLTRLTSRYLGSRKSIILAAILLSGAMFLFALNSSIIVAFIVVIMLGITDSFGLNHETDYFLSLDATERFGESKSMGVYSLFENLGEALGPLAYGYIMMFSMSRGISILAISLLIAIFMFMLLSRKAIPAKNVKMQG